MKCTLCQGRGVLIVYHDEGYFFRTCYRCNGTKIEPEENTIKNCHENMLKVYSDNYSNVFKNHFRNKEYDSLIDLLNNRGDKNETTKR